MANTAQARKRARQSVSRRERNMALRSKLRTFVKNVVKAIDLKDKSLAMKTIKKQYPSLMPVYQKESFIKIKLLDIKVD